MIRSFQIAFVALACLILSGCDILEGINQASPTYRRPLLFSTPWWEQMKIRKKQREILQFKKDWGLSAPKEIWIYQP